MRKTRLVILPGARCLHQLGFLLLFLACPTIAFKGQEKRDIQPYCQLLILKQNWIPDKTGEGIGCYGNIKGMAIGIWNMDHGNGNTYPNNNTKSKCEIWDYLNGTIDQNFKTNGHKSNLIDLSLIQKSETKTIKKSNQMEAISYTEVKRVAELNRKRSIRSDIKREFFRKSDRKKSISPLAQRRNDILSRNHRKINEVRENSVRSFRQSMPEQMDARITDPRRVLSRFDSRSNLVGKLSHRRELKFESERRIKLSASNSPQDDMAERRMFKNSETHHQFHKINLSNLKSASVFQSVRHINRDIYRNDQLPETTSYNRRELQTTHRDTTRIESPNVRLVTRSRDSFLQKRQEKTGFSKNESRKMFIEPLLKSGRVSEERRFSPLFDGLRVLNVKSIDEKINYRKINQGGRRLLSFSARRISEDRRMVRENSLIRSNVRRSEERKYIADLLRRESRDIRTMNRGNSVVFFPEGLSEPRRPLIREKRSVDSLQRNFLERNSENKRMWNREVRKNSDSGRTQIRDNLLELLQWHSKERRVNREMPVTSALLRNSEHVRIVSRRSQTNCDNERILFREMQSLKQKNSIENIAREDYFRQSLERNTEGSRRNSERRMPQTIQRKCDSNRNLPQQMQFLPALRINSDERRYLSRDNYLTRSLERIFVIRRNSEHKRTLSRALQRINENRRLSRDIRQMRTDKRRSISREGYSPSSERNYDARRNSETRRDVSQSLEGIHERRDLTRETHLVRTSSDERRSMFQDYLIPASQRNLHERRSVPREVLFYPESQTRHPKNRRLLSRRLNDEGKNFLSRIYSSKSLRLGNIKDRRIRVVKTSKSQNLLRRTEERIFTSESSFSLSFGKSESTSEIRSRQRNERNSDVEASLKRRTLFTERSLPLPSHNALKRTDSWNSVKRTLARGNSIELTMQRYSEARIVHNSQTFLRDDQQSIQRSFLNSRKWNNYAGKINSRSVDFTNRITEERSTEDARRFTRMFKDKLSARISFGHYISNEVSIRRNVRERRLAEYNFRTDSFVRTSPRQLRLVVSYTSNYKFNEKLLTNTNRNRKLLQKLFNIDHLSGDKTHFALLTSSLETRISSVRKDAANGRIAINKNQILSSKLRGAISNTRRRSVEMNSKSDRFSFRPNQNIIKKKAFGESVNKNNNIFNSEDLSWKVVDVENYFDSFSLLDKLFENIKLMGASLFDNIEFWRNFDKLNFLKSLIVTPLKVVEKLPELHEDNVNGLWNAKRLTEDYNLPETLAGGALWATLFLNTQKREIY